MKRINFGLKFLVLGLLASLGFLGCAEKFAPPAILPAAKTDQKKSDSEIDGDIDISSAQRNDIAGYSTVATCMGSFESNPSHYQVVQILVSLQDPKKFMVSLHVASKRNPSMAAKTSANSAPYFISIVEPADKWLNGENDVFVAADRCFAVSINPQGSKVVLMTEPTAFVRRRIERTFDCVAKKMNVK
jgi:hypothetical protein